MHVKKNETKAMSLAVTEGLTVTILPNLNHEFLMTTKEVANGYGTTIYAINMARMRHEHELINGKHFETAITKCYSELRLPPNAILWTKRGIIRLGFFIKSERAKLFRDWAEELVINKLEQPTLFDVLPTRQLPSPRKHNRLTAERMIDILADICQIEDKELRLSLTNKLMGGMNHGC